MNNLEFWFSVCFLFCCTSQSTTVRSRQSEKKSIRTQDKEIHEINCHHSSSAALVLKDMPLLSLTVNHEMHHGKKNPTSCIFFNNNNRCPLRSYEMDKLLENKSWNVKEWASYMQQNLSIHYTSIRHCNSKTTEVRKAMKKTLRHNRSFHGGSADHVIKQSLTKLQKPQTNIFKWSYIIHPWAFCIVFGWNGQMLYQVYVCMCPAFLIDLSPHYSKVKNLPLAYFSMVSPQLVKQRKKTIYLTVILI